MSIDTVLAGKLIALGIGQVWSDERPADSSLPAVVFRKVSRKNTMTFSGPTDKVRDRFQIIVVASTPAVRETNMSAIETMLIGNHVDFNIAWASETYLQNKEADNIYSASRDFFIFD
jgi:hypothetical protein